MMTAGGEILASTYVCNCCMLKCTCTTNENSFRQNFPYKLEKQFFFSHNIKITRLLKIHNNLTWMWWDSVSAFTSVTKLKIHFRHGKQQECYMSQNTVNWDVWHLYINKPRKLFFITYCQKKQTALAYLQPTPYYGSPALVLLTGEAGCQKMKTMKKSVVWWTCLQKNACRKQTG